MTESGSLRERIKGSWATLNRSERTIAQHVLDIHPHVAFETVQSLGEATDTSARSVMRLVQKLGYPGYPELQADVQAEIEARLSSPVDRFRTDAGGAPWMEQVMQNLLAIGDESGTVDKSAKRLVQAKGRVLVFGTGKPAAIATYLRHELVLVRPRVSLLDDADLEIIDDAFDVGPKDALVLCEFRRYPRLGTRLAAFARAAGAYVLVIADSALAPAAASADDLLVVRTGSTFLFDSYVAALAVVDLLVARVAEMLPAAQVTARLRAYDEAAERGGVFSELGGRS